MTNIINEFVHEINKNYESTKDLFEIRHKNIFKEKFIPNKYNVRKCHICNNTNDLKLKQINNMRRTADEIITCKFICSKCY